MTWAFAQAATAGWTDQVVYKGGGFQVRGWACQPGLGQTIQVDLWVGGIYRGRFSTGQPAEGDVHTACGSALNHRFSIPLPTGVTPGSVIAVNAVDSSGSAAPLLATYPFEMPNTASHPEAAIAAASRILLVIAHPDDEVLFAPLLGRYCGPNSSKACKIISATNGRSNPNEFINSAAMFNATVAPGDFPVSGSPTARSTVIAGWEAVAANVGLVSMNNVIKLQIDAFQPDAILTFHPRLATDCHPDHRAVGKVVVDGVQAYSGSYFPDKTKVFLLGHQRYGGTDLQHSFSLAPIVPADGTSVVYYSGDVLPAQAGGKIGQDFMKDLIGLYPSQVATVAMPPQQQLLYPFPTDYGALLDAQDEFNKTTVFQRITDYLNNPNDSRYSGVSFGNDSCDSP